jgi:RimJ/RimL family protein N-acetyltransferase
MANTRVVPTTDEHIEGFHRVIGIVARERRYIGFVDAPPLEGTREFIRGMLASRAIQLLVLDDDDAVVGWCDIIPVSLEGFQHVGKLGMGLLPEFRGRGLGEALARAAIDRAWEAGLERVELEVFASNARARRLYERMGFVVEGVKRRARKLDGEYDDNVLMALLRDDHVTPNSGREHHA